jgi:tetratricopeptide (TPR) repeat protein
MGRSHSWLSEECLFSGAYQPSIVHGEQAVALLERTAERFWLGRALYSLGIAYYYTGDLHRTLELATRVQTLGTTIGDRRHQVTALTLMGQSYTAQGAWEAAIEALQHAVTVSADAFDTALVIGYLGYAYLEQGDRAEALPLLEQAVQQARQYRSRQVQCQAILRLGEAYRLDGQIDKAQDLACQGLATAEDITFPLGVGLAQRLLGRIAQASDDPAEAQTYLQAALATLASIQSRYELARTHLDLASLANTQDDQGTATMHLSTAHAWFKKLQVPKWVEKTEQLAREYGVTLKEVELEELTEGDR